MPEFLSYLTGCDAARRGVLVQWAVGRILESSPFCNGDEVACVLQIVQIDFVTRPIFPAVKRPGHEASILTVLMSIRLGAVQLSYNLMSF